MAQAVLRGETKGYRKHPQLERFKNCESPLSAISIYLKAIYEEAVSRGYAFNKSKIKHSTKPVMIKVTVGQMHYEQSHLMEKLKRRNPAVYSKWYKCNQFAPHPIFEVHSGEIEPWERQ